MSFEIIDISKDLLTAELYPGDPKPEVSIFSAIARGDECNMAKISSTLHCGTHADAPLHFINGGDSIGTAVLDSFIGECAVIDVPPGRITGQYADEHFPKGVKRLLLRSGGTAYFDKTGAEETAYLGYKLIGTDAMSVGSPEDQTEPHKALLGENVAILESLNLDSVKPGRYFLIAPPVKIAGVDAAPVRAVLISGYMFWSN